MPDATTSAQAPAFDRDDLLEMFRQLQAVGSVELKMNVPGEQRMALRSLRLDTLQGRIREVVFFDTPDLTLFHQGVVVRGRRTQGSDDDTVVKLRPTVPGDLPPAVRDSPNLKVEMDVTRGSYVVSASLKGRRQPGAVRDVLFGGRSVEKLLTKEQRPFLADHLPEGVQPDDLVPLGPILVVFMKFVPDDVPQRFTIEQWHYPGQVPLVELSTKAAPVDALRVYDEAVTFLRGRGLRPTGEQVPKTGKALRFFARQLAPAPK